MTAINHLPKDESRKIMEECVVLVARHLLEIGAKPEDIGIMLMVAENNDGPDDGCRVHVVRHAIAPEVCRDIFIEFAGQDGIRLVEPYGKAATT
jgi:hypothetical protein